MTDIQRVKYQNDQEYYISKRQLGKLYSTEPEITIVCNDFEKNFKIPSYESGTGEKHQLSLKAFMNLVCKFEKERRMIPDQYWIRGPDVQHVSYKGFPSADRTRFYIYWSNIF